jgi:energy-coupling factor transporter transmembrane protein EcfT
LLFYLIISIAFILTVNSTSIRLKKDRNHWCWNSVKSNLLLFLYCYFRQWNKVYK